jgi:16S rRNA (guanine966-N2)-methyltransferase
VRIIGGRFRGRVVRFPPGSDLRPTPDRVRETLFNWLGQSLDEQSTLEPFAGTGVLSLEAVSRGAVRAVAVDRDAVRIRALAATAEAFGAAALEARTGDAKAWLARDPARYHVIFLDPPFASDPWAWLLPAAAARLAPGGLIYAESGGRIEPPGGLALVRSDKAGHVHYHLLARAD